MYLGGGGGVLIRKTKILFMVMMMLLGIINEAERSVQIHYINHSPFPFNFHFHANIITYLLVFEQSRLIKMFERTKKGLKMLKRGARRIPD